MKMSVAAFVTDKYFFLSHFNKQKFFVIECHVFANDLHETITLLFQPVVCPTDSRMDYLHPTYLQAQIQKHRVHLYQREYYFLFVH